MEEGGEPQQTQTQNKRKNNQPPQHLQEQLNKGGESEGGGGGREEPQQEEEQPQSPTRQSRYSLRERKPARVFSPPQLPSSPRKVKRIRSIKSKQGPADGPLALPAEATKKGQKELTFKIALPPSPAKKRSPAKSKSKPKPKRLAIPLPPPPVDSTSQDKKEDLPSVEDLPLKDLPPPPPITALLPTNSLDDLSPPPPQSSPEQNTQLQNDVPPPKPSPEQNPQLQNDAPPPPPPQNIIDLSIPTVLTIRPTKLTLKQTELPLGNPPKLQEGVQTAPIFMQNRNHNETPRAPPAKTGHRGRQRKSSGAQNSKAPQMDKLFLVQSDTAISSSQPLPQTLKDSNADKDNNDNGNDFDDDDNDDDDDDDFIALPVRKSPRTSTIKKAASSPQVFCPPPNQAAQTQKTLLGSPFVVVEHTQKTPQRTPKQKEQPCGSASGKKRQQRQTTLFPESPKTPKNFTPKNLDEAREKLLLESMAFNKIVEKFTSKSTINPLFAPCTPQGSRGTSAKAGGAGLEAALLPTSDQQRIVIDISLEPPAQSFSTETHVRQLSQAEEASMMSLDGTATAGKIEFMEPDTSDPGLSPLKPRDLAEEEEEEEDDEEDAMETRENSTDYVTRTLKELHEIMYGKGKESVTPATGTGDAPPFWAETETRYNKLREGKEKDGAQHMLWVDKYKPQSLGMVCGNKTQFEALSKWLSKWTLGQNAEKQRPRSKWDDDDDDDRVQNMCVIQGDFSTCKTAGVYTCAAERGMEVIEINASELRSSKQISKIGEASSTRQFATTATTTTTTTAPQTVTAASFFSKPVPKNKQKQKSQTQQQQEAKRRVFLFEDIDVFFPCDTDMHSSIIALEQKTSYPIIATCRYLTKETNKIREASIFLPLKGAEPSEIEYWARLCLLAERGDAGVHGDIGALCVARRGLGLRHVLSTLQFWLLTPLRGSCGLFECSLGFAHPRRSWAHPMGALAHAASAPPGTGGTAPLQRLLEVAHTSALDIGFNNWLAYLNPHKAQQDGEPEEEHSEATAASEDPKPADTKPSKKEWAKRCEVADALSVTAEHLSSLDTISAMCGGWDAEQRFPDPWHRTSPESCGYEAEAIAYALRRIPVEEEEEEEEEEEGGRGARTMEYGRRAWDSQENAAPVRDRHKAVMRGAVGLWRFGKNMQWHVAGNAACFEALGAAGCICASENNRYAQRLTRRFTHHFQYCTDRELGAIQDITNISGGGDGAGTLPLPALCSRVKF